MTALRNTKTLCAAGAGLAIAAASVFMLCADSGLLYRAAVLSTLAAFPRASVSALAKAPDEDEPKETPILSLPKEQVKRDEILPDITNEPYTAQTVYADADVAQTSIPEENRGEVKETTYASFVTSQGYFFFDKGCVRNGTAQSDELLASEAAKPVDFKIEPGSALPQVLIFHTHTTESYGEYDAEIYDVTKPVRSTDDAKNVIAVGGVIASRLNADGINTLHATEYHDYPSFEDAYMRSADTVKGYLAKYPSIKVVLDVHRDGIESGDGTRMKPVIKTNGEKAAQIMLVCNADDGSMGHTDYLKNLRFAARIQNNVETMFCGLARPVLFDCRDYNQFLSSGMLLVEVGSHGNTLDEAKRAAECFARALAETLRDLQ